MTDKKDLKRHIRERMSKTGESYTAARRNLLPASAPDPRARARALVQRAIEREPRLTAFGIGVWGQQVRTGEFAIAKEFAEERARLVSDDVLDQVETCARWLELQVRTKTLNKRHTSYGYKHHVEDWIGRTRKPYQHISNGALIAAALGLGFDFRPDHLGSPNLWLNLSERRWRLVLLQAVG